MEYTEYFEVYMNLGNQDVTNAGQMIHRYIPLFRVGLLSQSMWGSLRFAPIIHMNVTSENTEEL